MSPTGTTSTCPQAWEMPTRSAGFLPRMSDSGPATHRTGLGACPGCR